MSPLAAPARTATTVHLLRHGEVANPDGVLYGRLPGYRLSADGERMAGAAAAALAGGDVALVVSSPLERAVQTAELVAGALGLPVELDERLVEPWNAFEGQRLGAGAGALRRPAAWRHLRNPFRPSWGEPYREVAERMAAAVAALRERAAGRQAVAVSHQLPICVLRRSVEGRPLWHRPDRRLCGLASLTSLEYSADGLARIVYTEPAGAAGRRGGTGA